MAMDGMFLGLAAALFMLMVGLVIGCERLSQRGRTKLGDTTNKNKAAR